MELRKEEVFMSERKNYTVDDIRALPENVRAELIDGELFIMESPGRRHQDALMWLENVIYNHIKARHGRCRVNVAPFGVYIKEDGKHYLEPDIVVNCDRDRLQSDGCHGAPDLVVEIISPSSKTMDRVRKLAVYQETGVREYWIMDPVQETLLVYDLKAGSAPVLYHFKDTVSSLVLNELQVNLAELKEYLDF